MCCVLNVVCKAIKTGRYTHEKRAKDIAEVKRLEQLRIGCSSSVTSSGANSRYTDDSHSSNTLSPSSELSGSECEQVVQRITSAYRSLAASVQKTLTEKENEFLVSIMSFEHHLSAGIL